ncbi:MAG: DedA family protein [Alloprevotella sp.]|nr:DedA family protein [Alloprevotella sp.]
MEQIQQFFIEQGYIGMFLSAFLAGSVLPFSSEFVMIALLAIGSDSSRLLLWGTLGNWLGALVNYKIGSLGNTEWIEHWTHVQPDKLEAMLVRIRRHGAWMGLLAWVPVMGSVVTVSLGFLRTPFWPTILAIGLGKFVRYLILVLSYESIF